MKKLTTLFILALVASTLTIGCAKKGDTKDDASVTEGREIEPATSGGMQRMEEEEPAAAPDDEAPAEPAASDEDGGEATPE